MATIYYNHPGPPSYFGTTDNAADVPPGADIITASEYTALLDTAMADQEAQQQAAKEAAELEFRTAFKGSRAGGANPSQAFAVARPAGLVPATFDPDTEPFTPLGIVLGTPLDNPAFGHNLTGADAVWEHVDEIPDLVIPEPGEYRVTLTARGNAGVAAGTASATSIVYAGVALNGTVIPGTETIVSGVQSGPGTARPPIQTDASGSVTFTKTLQAGDVLRVYGARISANSYVSSISSSAIGRTRLVAQRIALAE